MHSFDKKSVVIETGSEAPVSLVALIDFASNFPFHGLQDADLDSLTEIRSLTSKKITNSRLRNGRKF